MALISVVIPVYRNAEAALRLVAALHAQKLADSDALEIILVDDGSGDDTGTKLTTADGSQVRILSLTQNQGRGGARNAGATVAHGTTLAFIDCDCMPEDGMLLQRHLTTLRQGAIASCGPIHAPGAGFWARYQQAASRRRAQLHANGVSHAGTTANFVVCRSAFAQVGGFDSGYRRYGFEDRDVLVRLAAIGRIAWTETATMWHLDALTLPGVLAKMREAGGTSGAKFARAHPSAYQTLGFAAVDARLHPWLRLLGRVFGPLLHGAPTLDRVLDKLPFMMAAGLVRALSALAYMRGTMDSPGCSSCHWNE